MIWAIKKVLVKDLKEWSKNPRKFQKEKIEDLKRSIAKFGIAEPIVVNTDMVIAGGHGRKRALIELDIKEVDCYIPDRLLTEEEFSELNIRLNKNIAGEWNIDSLLSDFKMDDLIDWGFSIAELDVKIPEIDDVDKKVEEKEEFLLEIKFNNEMEMRDLYDDLTNKGYAVKTK